MPDQPNADDLYLDALPPGWTKINQRPMPIEDVAEIRRRIDAGEYWGGVGVVRSLLDTVDAWKDASNFWQNGLVEASAKIAALEAEVERQRAVIAVLAAEVEAFREAIRTGDGPSCEDVCLRECIGVCGVTFQVDDAR